MQPRNAWSRFGRTQAEANQGGGKELIATEQAGTQTRWQIGPVTPWAHRTSANQAVQPALGPG
ncbi:hypothetical protein SBA1_600012 [Candidatus Sulfotelmatobacter kueseliae]|uniref:Uncharacterized protein n=1 Tax=Candidatus Sulfotelmatobacter kueseliae TaxID=2042962 RepID=A0A2U3L1Q8_9BACT|nr:hypothetical protein SBA1_600012 [Candidatus Sulfotelmatobacter kueseliae]